MQYHRQQINACVMTLAGPAWRVYYFFYWCAWWHDPITYISWHYMTLKRANALANWDSLCNKAHKSILRPSYKANAC